MRQAGRYLPGYREVRSKNSFWDVCHNPELSTKVALEPLGLFKLDAAIVFSDILVVPEAMGLGVTFGPGEGPRMARPMRTAADFAAWKTEGVMDRLAFLPAAVKHLRAAIGDAYGLFGFAGAPWTLFAYCVEGGGSDDFRTARSMLYKEPQLAQKALSTIADVVGQLVEAQVSAGADVVQLFDTWAGLLTRDEYRKFAVPVIRRITDGLHAKGHQVLLFVRDGQHHLPVLHETGADGFSLDWRTPFREARALFPKAVLQGNIDPILLLAGPEVTREATRALLAAMKADDGARRCIVNLGHGLVPETPIASVEALCNEVAGHA